MKQGELINLSFLRVQIRNSDLKLYWIAEQAGVNRKTLSRWLNGSVRRAEYGSLVRLAKILNCDVASLILEEEVIANTSERKKAKNLLSKNQDLISYLVSRENWALYETVIQGEVSEELPAVVLGGLYNELGFVALVKKELKVAISFANQAFEIGERISDQTMMVRALVTSAQAEALGGKLDKSEEHYRHASTLLEEINDLEGYGVKINFLRAVNYTYLGQFQKAVQILEAFPKDTKDQVNPFTYAQFLLWHGTLQIRLKNYDRALKIFLQCQTFAAKNDLPAIVAKAKFYEVIGFARQGKVNTAEKIYESALMMYRKIHKDDNIRLEAKAAIFSAKGKHQDAVDLLTQVITKPHQLPFFTAEVLEDIAQSYSLLGQSGEAKSALKAAKALYASIGAKVLASKIN